MEHKPALYALIRLHAELHYRMQRNALEADRLREDMVHIEAVLKLLAPGFSVTRIASKRKNNPNPLFKRGTTFRAVLDVLREAPEPMTVKEICAALFRSKGVLQPSQIDRERLYGAVNASLDNQEGKVVEGDDGRPRRWTVLQSA